MASCAACLQPILRAQRFVIDGTEAFHAACIGQSYRSKQRLTEQRVRELENQLAETRRSAARVEGEANRLRNELESAHAMRLNSVAQVNALGAVVDLQGQSLRAREDELQASRAEVARLRAELAALKVADQESEPEVDPTVQRFRMLELD